MPNLSSVTTTGKHNVQVGSLQDCLHYCSLGGSQHAAYSMHHKACSIKHKACITTVIPYSKECKRKRHSCSRRSGEAFSNRIYRHNSCLPESCDNMHETWSAGEIRERPTAYSCCGELTLDIFSPVRTSPRWKEAFGMKCIMAANGLGRSGTAVI